MDTGRFIPSRAFIEEEALQYSLGEVIRRRLLTLKVPVRVMKHGQRPEVTGRNPTQVYAESKKTLVVRVRKEKEFSSCKPSAHYQLPLASSCPGLCEYCYLQTRLGSRPYLRVYANIEEILAEAGRLIAEREPEITVFEGAATSDPLATEHITGSLRRSIDFFGAIPQARFRFVTKFADVEPILGARHEGRTTVRFSVNANHVILAYEHSTGTLEQRLDALGRVNRDGYPVGVMIGPVITFDGWKEEYRGLLDGLSLTIGESAVGLPVEIITHRFTSRAKDNILSVFPASSLPMQEEDRRLVYGQFGYTKYVYSKETMGEVRDFFLEEVARRLPGARIEYLV